MKGALLLLTILVGWRAAFDLVVGILIGSRKVGQDVCRRFFRGAAWSTFNKCAAHKSRAMPERDANAFAPHGIAQSVCCGFVLVLMTMSRTNVPRGLLARASWARSVANDICHALLGWSYPKATCTVRSGRANVPRIRLA